MRIGIKVGSSLLDWGNMDFINELMRQIWELIDGENEVFLVSSGAVACGRHRNQIRSKALQAAVGQHKLMAMYQSSYWLKQKNDQIRGWRDIAQVLLIADELSLNRQHIQNLIEECFAQGVLPIINANDAVNGDELDRLEQFEDNDNLFLEVCYMLKPDIAIIATDVDGVFDDNRQVIHSYSIAKDLEWRGYPPAPLPEDSFGTGGMTSKVGVAEALTEEGIKTIIVNGRVNDFVELAIKQLADGPTEGYSFGTVFVP